MANKKKVKATIKLEKVMELDPNNYNGEDLSTEDVIEQEKEMYEKDPIMYMDMVFDEENTSISFEPLHDEEDG